MSATMEGNCVISGQKPNNRKDMYRHLRYMAVLTAVAVNIKQNAYTNIMQKETRIKTRS